MSLFQMPSLRKVFARFDGLRSSDRRQDRKAPKSGWRKPRSLVLDPLEDRILLSVSPTDTQATLVTQALSSVASVNTETNEQPVVAMDNDGNFVVVWSQNDGVYDSLGNAVIDTKTGAAMTDYNIYARYFTDTVQRLTLPTSVFDESGTGHISLTYGGSEVQTLTLSTATGNYVSGWGLISCQLVFTFDTNGDGTADLTSGLMDYRESWGAETNATNIQSTLTAMGGALGNVTVGTNSTNEYTITFGSNQKGVNQALIGVTIVSSSSGFLPAAVMSTERQPGTIVDIPIYANEPAKTAQAIESYFTQTQTNELTPSYANPEDLVTTVGQARVGAPELTVTPAPNDDGVIDGTVFDITFTGATGKSEQPQLVVASLKDAGGDLYDGDGNLYSSLATVLTTKGPSELFRVNPEEPDLEWTYLPDVEDQYNPTVAMDADGTTFVITWESSVTDVGDASNTTDIFACRFSPSGYQTDNEDTVGDGDTDIVGVNRQRAQREELWTFTFASSAAVEGTFYLYSAGGLMTGEITFDSTDLDTVASQMATQLGVAYPGIDITVVKTSNAYQFKVVFPNDVLSADTTKIQLGTTGTTSPLAYNSFGTEQTNSDDGYTFLVNTTTGNNQIEPAVGMDADGNFVIAWAARGQELSFFNGIYAQRYNKYGEKLAAPSTGREIVGSQWRLDTESTMWTLDPYVSMSDVGYVLVTWTETNDPNYVQNDPPWFVEVRGTLLSTDGTVMAGRDDFSVGGGGRSASAFDANNNYVITWGVIADHENNGGDSEGVHAVMWSIAGTQIRSEFRVNSADLSGTSSATTWPGWQGYGQPALDADGDLVVAYSGFGPDVSQTVWLDSTAYSYLVALFSQSQNTDLRTYFDPGAHSVSWFNSNYCSTSNTTSGVVNGDVDGTIEAVLIDAQRAGASNAQLGRISALLEEVLGLLRGDADGVMYSQFDTAATGYASPRILASDMVVNTLRDGNNARFYLTIDRSSTGGNFVVRVVSPLVWAAAGTTVANYVDITIAPVYTNSVFDIERTRAAIELALRGASVLGDNWVYQTGYDGDVGEGPVDVRTVFSSEITEREGTAWDISNLFSIDITGSSYPYAVYEITFQGESHDSPTDIYVYNYTGTLTRSSVALPAPQLSVYEWGDGGTSQTRSSIAMTPEGSFVIAWQQYDENSNGGQTSASYYFRYYQEASDTAGPTVTDLMGPDGSSLEDGGTLNFSSADAKNVVVVTFSEKMATSGVTSVENVSNWVLLKDGVPVTGGIESISFGMNRAYDLSQVYGLDATQNNTWQAVVKLSDNLSSGTYTLQALAKTTTTSGVTDPAGNTLSKNGFTPAGATFSQSFVVTKSSATDSAVLPGAADPQTPAAEDAVALITAENTLNGHTDAETARAVAADSSGAYVVVWTASVENVNDSGLTRDRLFYRLYNADGTVAKVPEVVNGVRTTNYVDCPVLEVDSTGTSDQRYGSVAMDADGDFVITWTDYASGADSGASAIKVQRFNAIGNLLGAEVATDGSGNTIYRADGVTPVYKGVHDTATDPLYGGPVQVNSITYGNPKWSTVAMDAGGNFVITWTTYGQEQSQLGATYGVFARRFGSDGVALVSDTNASGTIDAADTNVEFQVNALAAGNQHSASVAMDAAGDFIVTWISDQNGNDDIYYRRFLSSGVAVTTNDQTAVPVPNWLSDQSYPSVALDVTGTTAVITFTSSAAPTGLGGGWDDSGDGVYASRLQFPSATTTTATLFQVNTTTIGNQGYSSVAIDHSGAFVITWSGRGTQSGQLDTSGSGGVYYQRYTNAGARSGGETRANVLTVGNQWLSSVACDANGDIVLAWTGVDADQTAVYNARINNPLSLTASVGPWVSGVVTESGTLNLAQNATVNATNQLVVLFDESMSVTNGSKGLDSVLNLNNWTLMKNGVKVTNGIQNVTFVWNKVTRKYEATVTFKQTLAAGTYALIASDVITDGVNRLDGDFNGTTGTAGSVAGYQFNFVITSTGTDTAVATPTATVTNPHTDAETAQAVAVDDDGDYVVVWTAFDTATQTDRVYFRLYDIDGTPANLPLVDENGAYQYELDGVTVKTADAPIMAVDPTFVGNQRYASVAMDADGDFIITWTSYQGTSTTSDIMARRFNALANVKGVYYDGDTGAYVGFPDTGDAAVAYGGPFTVNSTLTGNQKWSSVAMDAAGDFVITWSSEGRDNADGSWGVYARRYDAEGNPVTSDTNNSGVIDAADTNYEFLVNTTTAGDQYDSSVSMSATGRFVITWTLGQPSGSVATTGDGISARSYNANGAPATAEVVVNANIPGNQQFSSVALSADGSTYVVAWTSAAEDGSGDGVYARQFNFSGTAQPGQDRVNTTTLGDQTYASVAMDHSGAYVITWSGAGTQSGEEDNVGVYYQRFNSTGTAQGTETLVNNTTAGKQWLSSVDTDARGNLVIAWTGVAPADASQTAVFTYSSYTSVPLPDLSGSWVTGVTTYDADSAGQLVLPGETLAVNTLAKLTVLFDERLSESTVENRSNWLLKYNGTEVVNGISSVDFSYNQYTGKWEAVVTFDANGLASGVTPLGVGDYVLVARTTIADYAGNLLDGDFDGTAGTSTLNSEYPGYAFAFSVSAMPFDQSVETGTGQVVPSGQTVVNAHTEAGAQAVASDDDGDYVVVWTAYDAVAEAERVYFRLYDADGKPAQVPLLDSSGAYVTDSDGYATVECPVLQLDTSFSGDQRYASVAMDADGDFVITWTSYADGSTAGDIRAMRFNAMANLKGVQQLVGSPGVYVPYADPSVTSSVVPVNTYTAGSQKWSNVAMDADGDFVITWTSYGQEAGQYGSTYGVYARRFDSFGTALASDTNRSGAIDVDDTDVEFLVNTTTAGNQRYSSVAMSAQGLFVITWTSDGQSDGSGDDVVVRVFDYSNPDYLGISGELRANGAAPGNQRYSDVAFNTIGSEFVVVWSGPGTTGDGSGNAVFSRSFSFTHTVVVNPGSWTNTTTVSTTSGDVQVNTSTLGDQAYPSIAMNRLDAYVVAWSGYGTQTAQKDDDAGGVFYQRYSGPNGTAVGTETRANSNTTGEQSIPSVASDADGNLVVVWTGATGLVDNPTSVYMFNTRSAFEATDVSGPWVSDVKTVDADNPTGGTRVLQGGTIQVSSAGLSQLKVLFDEEMGSSVSTVSNWTVVRNGVVLSGAIKSVACVLNEATGKYEATLTFNSGVMTVGSYVLTVRDLIQDTSNNALDGDFNGTSGTDYQFSFTIAQATEDNSVVSSPATDPAAVADLPGENIQNSETGSESRSVAVDDDGNYVVVWTAYDSTTQHYRAFYRLYDANGTPASMPLYDNNTFTGDFAPCPVLPVTAEISGDQRYASVAMDPDGDFVITWTEFAAGSTTDGDIKAMQFNAMGNLKGVREVVGAVRADGSLVYAGVPQDQAALGAYGSVIPVNTYTVGMQKWSNVAMDVNGDFVVTWSSYGQEPGMLGKTYGVYARRFGPDGIALISDTNASGAIDAADSDVEFLVSTTTAGSQYDSSVAMSAQGRFVISWTFEGFVPNYSTGINARSYDASGVALTGEINSNATGEGNQLDSAVAVSVDGTSYVVTWVSAEQDGSGDGVYMRRFTLATGVALSGEVRVNTTTAGDQTSPSVSMDHTGGYVIAWSGYGTQTGQVDTSGSGGVFYQRYTAAGVAVNGEVRVNSYTDGSQYAPTIGSDATGNFVVAWAGDDLSGLSDTSVYTYASASKASVSDAVGPWVTGVTTPVGQSLSLILGVSTTLTEESTLGQVTVNFDSEPCHTAYGSTSWSHSVLNPSNWVLSLNRVNLANAIQNNVTCVYNPLTRKWEVTVKFDANGSSDDTPALGQGAYILTLRDSVTDGANTLDGNYDGVADTTANVGGYRGFAVKFVIPASTSDVAVTTSEDGVANNATTYAETQNSVAADDDGDYVVVWTAWDTQRQRDRVYYRLYDRDGTPADLPLLNASGNYQYELDGVTVKTAEAPIMEVDASTPGHQRYASVAMDADGDFVITWTSYTGSEADVYARHFTATANLKGLQEDTANPGEYLCVVDPSLNPQSATSDAQLSKPFRVNSQTTGSQKWSAVAMDADGDFVITWSSSGQENNGQSGLGYGVYARRYDVFAQPQSTESQVNVTMTGDQRFSSVSMDAAGGYVVVWCSNADGSDDILLRSFWADGSAQTATEQLVNQTTAGNQRHPDVALSADGATVVVTWTSTSSGTNGDDVYRRTYLRNTNEVSTQAPQAAGAEQRVNTTLTGDQGYSSVAMDHSGAYIITWSGRGTQAGASDTSGVFYQRFSDTDTAVGSETRANRTISGSQYMASVATDAEGNFVMAWTGVDPTSPDPDAPYTTVFQYASATESAVPDAMGPWVSGVIFRDPSNPSINGDIVLDGDVIVAPATGVTTLTLLFDEELSTSGGTTGASSVLNPDNWRLDYSGSASVKAVDFAWNPTIRKWQAVVTFDGNGLNSGAPALSPGNYTLAIRDAVTDVNGNALDGDFNGTAGTNAANTGFGGYEFHFVLVGASEEVTYGPEQLVDGLGPTGQDTTAYNQETSAVLGTGQATEQSVRAVAMDHEGDYVVVWTSYGQDGGSDDPDAATNGGIYFRLYNKQSEALTTEILVNTTTKGNQRNASVAMDADGDFVVVWESYNSATKDWNVYARRFDSTGMAVVSDTNGDGAVDGRDLATEMLVNTTTANNQLNPSVAMDDYGNFVVVWATVGQASNYSNEIRGQLYNYDGARTNQEFVINSQTAAGTAAPGESTVNVSVAMNGPGDFVVVWDQITQQTNGVDYDSQVYGRMYNSDGSPNAARPGAFVMSEVTTAFLSDSTHTPHVAASGGSTTEHRARNAQVSMDDAGNFLVAWEAYQDNDLDAVAGAESYGIYYQTFSASGISTLFAQANTVITTATGTTPNAAINSDDFAGDQVNASVAMSANGDYSIVWNGRGAMPAASNPTANPTTNFDSAGVWIRTFHVTAGGGTEAVTVQSRVNMTSSGYQGSASIAMDKEGNTVVVWSGNGVGDRQGIFSRYYAVSTDTLGPVATELRQRDAASGATGDLVSDNEYLSGTPTSFVVVFDEELTKTGAGNVENKDNWALTTNAGDMVTNSLTGASVITGVTFGKNPSTNKWEAIVSLDSSVVAGLQNGTYILIARNTIQDTKGNVLGLSSTNSTGLTSTKFVPAGVVADRTDLPAGYAFRFYLDVSGDAEDPVVDDSADISTSSRSMAVDDDGDFALAWTSGGKVYMQLFGSDNTPITSTPVLVSGASTKNASATVAMNATGDFVVVWERQTSSTGWDIFAQRFDAKGNEVGDEIAVNTFTSNNQRNPTVAMDDYGNFAVTWVNAGTTLNEIHAQLFDFNGDPVGDEFQVNERPLPGGSTSVAPDLRPTVSMSGTGTFVVAWERGTQTNGVITDSVIVGRLFDRTGSAIAPATPIAGTTSEFAVSSGGTPFLSDATHTPQTAADGGTYAHRRALNPQATMDDDGNFIVTWQAYEDNDLAAVSGPESYGIYFQRFDATADAQFTTDHQANLVITTGTGTTPSSTNNSDNFAGDQVDASVAMDANGNYVIVWSGNGAVADATNPDRVPATGADDAGVWIRTFRSGSGLTAEYTSTEERVNVATADTQRYATVAMTPSGEVIVVWASSVDPDHPEHSSIYVRRYSGSIDNAGPIATELQTVESQTTSGKQELVADSENLDTKASDGVEGISMSGVTSLYVVFDEQMWGTETDVNGAHSVTNLDNWVLTGADGTVIQNAIQDINLVDKSTSSSIRKWEVEVVFSTALFPEGLTDGGYILIARDTIYDMHGNSLARNGYRPEAELTGGVDPTAQAATSGFGFRFFVNQPQEKETPITDGDEEVEISSPTGSGTEQSTRSVAISDSGSYAVAWTQVATDGSRDVYMILYGADGRVLSRDADGLSGASRVNTTTAGDQKLASVAMDADGDFVVVWEGYNSATTSWDVFARRYDARGNAVVSDTNGDGRADLSAGDTTNDFVVNTAKGGNQLNPTVAMDDYGNFVVVWVSAGSGGNTLYGQLFDYAGCKSGGQFQVNEQSLPSSSTSTTSVNVNPSVSMSGTGTFVVVWDRVTAQSGGSDTDSVVVGRAFQRDGTAIVPTLPIGGTTSEFAVSLGTSSFVSDATHTPHTPASGGTPLHHRARNPQVSMTDEGVFTVTWEAYEDNDTTAAGADSYGIYYRRFTVTATTPVRTSAVTIEDHQANLVVTTTAGTSAFSGDQVNASVAMDEQGNYIIVWNGEGAVPNSNNAALTPTSVDEDGVWLRTFQVGSGITAESTAGQRRVNTTQAGEQGFASVAMTPDGDAVVVWISTAVDGTTTINSRRYAAGESDAAGPLATELHTNDYETASSRPLVADGGNIAVLDRTNAPLTSLVVTFDEAMEASSKNGMHSVENPSNWLLASGDGSIIPGAVSNVDFAFNPATNKWEATVSFDTALLPSGLADGSYTLIVRDTVADVSGNELGRIGYRPESSGTANAEVVDLTTQTATAGFGFNFRVNGRSPVTPADNAVDTQVNTLTTLVTASATARNSYGQTVVVWVAGGDIYAQRYTSDDHALGGEILVNTIILGEQAEPSVAIDDDGDFVVVWSGDGTSLGDDSGIFGQRFNWAGEKQSSQFLVNVYTTGTSFQPSVACDNVGDFVVTWTYSNPGGGTPAGHTDTAGIYGRFYNQNGAPVSGEIAINTPNTLRQERSSVAMDSDGDVVAVWQSYGQDGNSWGVYGQRFNKNGTTTGKGSEFLVNSYTSNRQYAPSVAMDSDGDFVVAWSSFGQDNSSYGIYFQRYNAAGSKQLGETRANVTTIASQDKPSVSMRRSNDANDGDFVITWTGYDQEVLAPSTQGIYAHMFESDGSDFSMPDGTKPGEFRVNAMVKGDQIGSDVAMDAGGDYVVTWVGPNSTGTTTNAYVRFLDPPGQHSVAYTGANSTTKTLTGTSGNDTFTIVVGSSLGYWTVTVNGVAQVIPATTLALAVDGLGGTDTITVTLSATADTVDLSATSGSIVGGLGYTITLANLETITIDGHGGADTATFRDTAGNDSFTAKTNWAEHKATGYSHVLTNFRTVKAYGGSGTDTASLYGSTGSDTYVARPGLATMTSSLGYYYEATGFANEDGYAVAGGTDTASLYGSESADTLTARYNLVTLTDGKYVSQAKNFGKVSSYGLGGKDIARIYDSTGNDTFTASPTRVEMKAASFYVLAANFETVAVTSSSGYDVANLTDARGVNTLTASPSKATLTGNGYSITVNKFDSVAVNRVFGSFNSAYLYDSTGNDTFTSTPNYATLSGPGYLIRAKGFNSVYAYATAGTDVARLYGSSGNDRLDATNEYVKLYGSKFLSRAKSFKQVYAYGSGGSDNAYLTDAVMTEGRLAVSGLSSSYSEALWLSNFKTITNTKTATNTSETVQALDKIFTAQW